LGAKIQLQANPRNVLVDVASMANSHYVNYSSARIEFVDNPVVANSNS
jgi:hypothetical protein